jgi:hypothetical protein
VAFNKGHHVVFQREQVVRTHSQASILSDSAGWALRIVETQASALED